MKNIFIITFFSLFLVLGAYSISSNNVEIGSVPDVFAATDDSTIGADCTDPSAVAYVPTTVTYTINAATSSPAGVEDILGTQTNIGETAGINGGSTPTATFTLNGTNTTAGFASIVHDSPKMKVAQLQCQALSQTALDAYTASTLNAEAKLDVAFQADGAGDTTYTSANAVDTIVVGSPFKVAASSGGIISLCVDGSDPDGSTQGSIQIGGQAASSCLYEWSLQADVTNNDTQATDSEVVTFSFTPS